VRRDSAITAPTDTAPIFVLVLFQSFKDGSRLLKHMRNDEARLVRLPHASTRHDKETLMRNLNRDRLAVMGIDRIKLQVLPTALGVFWHCRDVTGSLVRHQLAGLDGRG